MYSESLIRRICESVGARNAQIRFEGQLIRVTLPDGNTEMLAAALDEAFKRSLMPGWTAQVLLEQGKNTWARVEPVAQMRLPSKIDRAIHAQHERRRREEAERLKRAREQAIEEAGREFDAAIAEIFPIVRAEEKR